MSVISEQMALRFDLDAEVQRSQTVGNKSHEPNVHYLHYFSFSAVWYIYCSSAFIKAAGQI